MDRILKFTILSLSFLTIITGAAVAPSLGVIRDSFSAVDPFYIKLILTLPALILVPFSILSGKLAQTYSKKKIIIVGLVLYAIGGVGAAFALNITHLLIMRIILGMGIGLILPLSTGLIADFYTGKERAKLMGLSTAVNNLGAVIAILLSGALSVINWRYIFIIYAVSILILILVILFLKNPPQADPHLEHTEFKSANLFRIALSMFILQVIYSAVPTNMALFISELQIGTTAISSVLLAALTLSSFAAGILYAQVSSILNTRKVSVPIGMICLGFVLLSTSQMLMQIGVGILLIGFSAGLLVPTFILDATASVPKNKTSFALAIITSGLFLGQFASPVVSDIIQSVLKLESVKVPFLHFCRIVPSLHYVRSYE